VEESACPTRSSVAEAVLKVQRPRGRRRSEFLARSPRVQRSESLPVRQPSPVQQVPEQQVPERRAPEQQVRVWQVPVWQVPVRQVPLEPEWTRQVRGWQAWERGLLRQRRAQVMQVRPAPVLLVPQAPQVLVLPQVPVLASQQRQRGREV